MLCELATSQLEALHIGVQAAHQPPQHQQSQGKSLAHALERQAALGWPLHSAHKALSQPYPHSSVNLTQLSTALSTIAAASQGMQKTWEHQQAFEQEHQTAVEKVQDLMMQTTREHATLFNDAMEAACM